jgi:hypothetical protein
VDCKSSTLFSGGVATCTAPRVWTTNPPPSFFQAA